MLKSALKLLIYLYRWTLGTILPRACRFHPSCSAYALEALERFGAGYGSLLALRRLLRCHPFSAGGYDPVPENFKTSGGKR